MFCKREARREHTCCYIIGATDLILGSRKSFRIEKAAWFRSRCSVEIEEIM